MRVLITGATSGLGREMALQLARRGWQVAVTGRRENRLKEVAAAVEAAGGKALPLLGGVTDLAVVKDHYARVKQAWGGLDWAILNAGVGESMNAKDFKADSYHWTFATNVGGVVNWLEAVLPDMIAQAPARWRGSPAWRLSGVCRTQALIRRARPRSTACSNPRASTCAAQA